jgi:hypothetical protein
MQQNEKHTALFAQLVFMLHASGMQHLGKLRNPLSGAVERDLQAAQGVIDLLDMLEHVTRGNLDGAEQRMLTDILRELRLNYVDEASKPPPAPESPTEEGEKP